MRGFLRIMGIEGKERKGKERKGKEKRLIPYARIIVADMMRR